MFRFRSRHSVAQGTAAEKRDSAFINALHVYTLFALAVVGPLLSVLAEQQTFFISHGTRTSDLSWFLLLLAVGLPGLLVVCAYLVGLFGRVPGKCFHLAVIASLVFLAGQPPLKTLAGLIQPGSWQFVSKDAGVSLLGALVAAAATILYARRGIVRSFVTWLSPGILFFPLMFLFGSDVTGILATAAQPSRAAAGTNENPRHVRPEAGTNENNIANQKKIAPVIMVVFDEFNGMSLLDERQNVDRVRFPNFARFADQATWFRNSTTNDAQTEYAIPAQLTGRFPDHKLRPALEDHPHNLFTLLADTHQLRVIEQYTDLCRDQWTIGQSDQENPQRDSGELQQLAGGRSDWQRFAQLAADAAVVYAHIVLPESQASWLPGIDSQWGNFVDLGFEDESLTAGEFRYHYRAGRFRQFIENITPSDPPGLFYLHNMLPHSPYEYLPSGRPYNYKSTTGSGDMALLVGSTYIDNVSICVSDELIAVLNQQRYLMQLQFVDRMVGEFIEHLQSVGMFDESLIVLTSDHGVSFQPGEGRRVITAANPQDILPTLFMIKAPFQRAGQISDHNVESVDVLPTIADILKVPIPWPIDGESGLDEAARARPVKRALCHTGKYEFDGKFPQRYDSARRTLTRFPSGADPNFGPRIAPHSEWIGRGIEQFEILDGSQIAVSIDEAVLNHATKYRRGRTPAIPAFLWGTAKTSADEQSPVELAIVVDGTVHAVTRTLKVKGWEDFWFALLPEVPVLKQNFKLDVYVVFADKSGFKLAKAGSLK